MYNIQEDYEKGLVKGKYEKRSEVWIVLILSFLISLII